MHVLILPAIIWQNFHRAKICTGFLRVIESDSNEAQLLLQLGCDDAPPFLGSPLLVTVATVFFGSMANLGPKQPGKCYLIHFELVISSSSFKTARDFPYLVYSFVYF